MMKTAMIWGAAGGIGQALIKELTANEWTVVSVSRHAEQLSDVAQVSLEADVTDEHAVQEAVLSAGYEVEQVKLWVYAVGDIASSRVSDMDPGAWQRIVGANLTGAYLTTHFSQPLLAADAHLFFLGAVSERLRLPGLAAYAAAKSGLEAFAEALRKEDRKRRISVVRPGAVDTPLWDKVPMRLPKDAAPAGKVAGRILEAYNKGHTGLLDLT